MDRGESKDDQGIDYHLLRSSIGIDRDSQYETWTEWNPNEAGIFSLEDGVSYDDSLRPYQSEELLIRSDLEELLDKYSVVDEMQRRKLDRSAYYFAVGQKLRQNADLATINFSIAVECLLEAKNPALCKECGKEQCSLSKMFRALLDKHAPVSEQLAARRDKLYSIRSMIAHGSRSLVADTAPLSLFRDRDSPLIMEWLVRKTIVGWLKAL